MLTLTDVLVDQVYTLSRILTWVTVAFVELILTAIACVSRITITCVACNSIYAGAMVAWIWLAVVDITLTESPFITWEEKWTVMVRDFCNLEPIWLFSYFYVRFYLFLVDFLSFKLSLSSLLFVIFSGQPSVLPKQTLPVRRAKLYLAVVCL